MSIRRTLRFGTRRTAAVTAAGVVLGMAACGIGPAAAAPSAGTSAAASPSGVASSAATASRGPLSSRGVSSHHTHPEAEEIALSDDGSTSSAESVEVDGAKLTITEGGVYRISGDLSDGQLVLAAPDDEAITLLLDGASITNSAGPAILVTSADEVTMLLAEGSRNTVADGTDYAAAEGAGPVAAISSTSDLTIGGSGALAVTGNANDGIATRHGIVIAARTGTITVQAHDDAISGEDYVSVQGGTLDLTSAGEALKSDNHADEDHGWVMISGGSLTVASRA